MTNPPQEPPPPPPIVPEGNPSYGSGASTAPNVGQYQAPLASFWQRLGAYLLDGLLYGLLASIMVGPAVLSMLSAADSCVTVDGSTTCASGQVAAWKIVVGFLLIFLASVLVFILYIRAIGLKGQTWGGKIAGVKVIGKDTGQPIGVWRAIGRALMSGISANVAYLGFLWMLWDRDQQTWHDKVVGSIVISV